MSSVSKICFQVFLATNYKIYQSLSVIYMYFIPTSIIILLHVIIMTSLESLAYICRDICPQIEGLEQCSKFLAVWFLYLVISYLYIEIPTSFYRIWTFISNLVKTPNIVHLLLQLIQLSSMPSEFSPFALMFHGTFWMAVVSYIV